MEHTGRVNVTEYFRARLAEEARRSERYGRTFAVIFVSCRQTNPREIFTSLRPILRSTDIVEVIRPRRRGPADQDSPPPPGTAAGYEPLRDRIAMILPETDRTGGEATLGRLRDQCVSLRELSMGLAVYPEDSDNPQELLALAARAAGETL